MGFAIIWQFAFVFDAFGDSFIMQTYLLIFLFFKAVFTIMQRNKMF